MNDLFLKFESEVMLRIIKEEKEIANGLTLQYENSHIIKRKFTGCGFFTDYNIGDKYRLKNVGDLQLGAVHADLNDMKYGVGFVLFINNGLITTLECYTYDEPFPSKFEYYKLS